MEHPQSMTARPRPSDLPWEAWVLGAATVVALVAGTVIRGFIGEEWRGGARWVGAWVDS